MSYNFGIYFTSYVRLQSLRSTNLVARFSLCELLDYAKKETDRGARREEESKRRTMSILRRMGLPLVPSAGGSVAQDFGLGGVDFSKNTWRPAG